MTKTIAWIINRFDVMGGGERLIQEGARYYRSLGYRVLIITWHYNSQVLFNGAYEELDIINLEAPETSRDNIFKRAISRAQSLPKLRKILKQNNVTTVFVQGEYDVALVYLSLLFSGIAYRFLIFGQMYQYPHDNAKYALIFRRHLKEIVASCQGYSETTSLETPSMSLKNRLANEFISVVRYFAVRGAQERFTFSRQLDWETGLLFNAKTTRARGAFRRQLLEAKITDTRPLAKFGLQKDKYILSISRLDRKKRIDIIIGAFAKNDLSNHMKLVIGGSGPDAIFLKNEVERLGLGDKVLFIGLVDEADLIPLKHDCAIFVSMDIGDYDISPLEALAVGTHAICPTEFDLDQILANCPGFHICNATTDDLANKLEEVLAKPKQFNKTGIDRLTWENYFDTLLDINTDAG